MHQHLLPFFKFVFVAKLYISNYNFTLLPKDFGYGSYSLICIMSFLINPIVKRAIVVFTFKIYFIVFSLCCFFICKPFLVCYFQFFLEKPSNNFFAFKVTNDYVHGTVFLTFLITKTLSDQFRT